METPAQLPDALLVCGYRGYADEQRLELRPLTVLFGRNNSGKSALLRALPLLSASIRGKGSQALDMAGPVARGASFDEMGSRGLDRSEDLEMRDMYLGLRWAGEVGVDVAFDWPDRKLVSVSGIRGAGGSWWRHRLVRETSAPGVVGFEALEDPRRIFAIKLSGLGFEPASEGIPPELMTARVPWNAFGQHVQWLSASRRPTDRRAEYSELTGSPFLAHDGCNIIAWLAERPAQVKALSAWYEAHLGARLVVSEQPPIGYEVRLEYSTRAGQIVNLLDTGEGNVQILPVLAALASAEDGSGPPIVVLEEPESHLHPHLQMALAQRIAEIITGDTEVRIVLETHSEHLLLAIQKLVLEGLDPAEISLYWVEQLADGRTCAERVGVCEDGTFDEKWPPGVFDDTLRLARRIMLLQLERSELGGVSEGM
jgi:predicted ATPase